MSNFVYSAMGGKNDPLFGKFEHPIKAIIENESNVLEKEKSILTALFNVEKSNRYAETVMGETDFGTFQSKDEGQRAENDSTELTFSKTIYHIEFGKEFTITRKMASDAKFGMGPDMKAKPRQFVRAYYRTRIEIAAKALINGTASSMLYNKATVDLTTGDGHPLFYNAHPFKKAEFTGKTQSNNFYTDLSDGAKLEEALAKLANKMRNFKDENGNTMGYVADTLIIPCNRPGLEMLAKKVVGSERTVGSDHNDINTQYGNWTIVVLDGWETSTDTIYVMSSKANEDLLGNMFYNREALDITSDIDKHTRNYFWNGYCRFGVGFNGWKHIARCVHGTSSVTGATSL